VPKSWSFSPAYPSRRRPAILAAVLIVTILGAMPASALSLIRDAETEELLRSYATPIFTVAGLNPRSVNIYLVNDNQINAFVSGGQNIFFTTELLLELDTPGEIKGVIAHEVGHIAGGHLARTQDAMKGTGALAIASMVLGVGVAALGAPEVGMGVMTGGTHVAGRNFLAYSRSQESAADQAAATYLDSIGESGEGLLEVMHKFSGQELLSEQRQDPFVRSHPVSLDRIGALEARLEKSAFRARKDPPELIEAHHRMQGKLYGFVKPTAQTMRKFPASDTSIKAKIARTVAYYLQGDLDKGLKEIDALIAQSPDNPFYHELKGQMLFENGRIRESIAPHSKAVELKPDSPLLRVNLAQAMLTLEDPALLKPSLEALELSMRQDPEIAIGWHQLAIAYARDGQEGMAALATAERFFRASGGDAPGRPSPNRRDALLQATRALKFLPAGSPASFRAQDIIDMVKSRELKNG
jgi:predicted Zn-dependent protease